MRTLRFIVCAAVLMAATTMLHAQGAGDYLAWLESNGVADGEEHYYISGDAVSIDGSVAEVTMGLGGTMGRYEITAQAVTVNEVTEEIIPVGSAVSLNGTHTGVYTEHHGGVETPEGATAIAIEMATSDASGEEVRLTLVIRLDVDLAGVSDLGMAPKCDPPCVWVTGKCKGCGPIAGKCCKGKRQLLNCPKCKIQCLDGNC